MTGIRRHRLDLAGDRRARREPAVHRQPQPRQGQPQRSRRIPDQPAELLPDHQLQRQSRRFTFDGRYSGLQANGIGLADFLLGIPARAGGAIGDSIQNLRTTYWAGYVQDDWRIVPNLTLNYGLRYEFARSPVERDNKSLVFAPELGQILLAGQGVRPDIVDPDWNNFAPRLGFTWRPPVLEDFVVRGGAGIYYATDNFNEEQFKGTGPPFFQAQTIEGDPRHAEPVHARHDAVVHQLAQREPVHVRPRQPDAVPDAVELRRAEEPRGRITCWRSSTPAARAASCRSAAISTSRRIDPTGTIPIVQRVPYPQYGFILMTYNGGWSSYNALTTKLEKRFSKGLYFLGSYTWQKSLDLGATDEFSALSAEFKKWDKGHSTFDVPHRFVGTLGLRAAGRTRPRADGRHAGCARRGARRMAGERHRDVLAGAVPDADARHRLAAARLVHDVAPERHRRSDSGPPAPRRLSESGRLRLSRATRRATGFACRATRGGTAFSSPASTTGTSGCSRTSGSAIGSTPQFRWETFNTWNHTQFGSANLNTSSPTFGRITGTRVGPRRMQFGLRLTF